ncbi:hypothetical protein V5P93_001578 [Actinokineospora auranticolor]|uniref:Extracellular solute-binding protein n=1 Tax=Actinokineospora auranticolor TaxID=155976 RepID=A0A2S6GVH0_9PSEU|nr:hypothetical protein [Actinokineospora auranticolor]PPK69199.1 hypothetical protein CLV40_104453 [Actinokineospora auranticolor]
MTVTPGVATEPDFTIVTPPRSAFRRKRFLGPFVPAAIIGLVGLIVLWAGGMVTLPFREVVVVTGRTASKGEFFADAEVKRILMSEGIQVDFDRAGSREIVTGAIDDLDFVFPSGQPAALQLRQRWDATHAPAKVFKPFFSPIVLATYRDYAEALVGAGVGAPQPSTGEPLYFNLPMKPFIDKIRTDTWEKLDPDLRNGNRVLAQTSDICSSNSAATYLGLVAFVENGNTIPQTEAEAVDLANRIKPLLTAQGLPGDDMSRSYLAPDGQGLAPIAVIYEHQYLAHQVRVRAQTGSLDTRRVLLYPAAQVQAVPEFIALTPAGERVGRLITEDPRLRRRALELGFRVFESDDTLTTGQFTTFLNQQGVPVPSSGVGDTETFLPALPLLEKMITTVGECPPPRR